MNIYDTILSNFLIPRLGKNATFSNDLKKIGLEMFGNKFSGVFAANQIPDNFKYIIINLDDHDEPGSHWIGGVKQGNEAIIYDSFGRDTIDILPNIWNNNFNIIDVDDDAEQRISENDCGPRSLAWLYVFDKFGKDAALLI